MKLKPLESLCLLVVDPAMLRRTWDRNPPLPRFFVMLSFSKDLHLGFCAFSLFRKLGPGNL